MRGATEPCDRGAVPIVGVILVVAVTIILAAVLSTFVLDLGESAEESGPTTKFEFTYSDKNNRVKVEMKTGDNLDGNLLRFSGAATEKTSFGSIVEWAGETVSAGDTATVEVESDETLLVVWQGNRSEKTAILGKYEVPKDPSATASIGSIDTSSTQNDGEVCVYNVQFSNAWGENVYIEAYAENNPSKSDTIVIGESGGDGKLDLDPGGRVKGFEGPIVVTVYETEGKNNALTSESKPPDGGGGCTV